MHQFYTNRQSKYGMLWNDLEEAGRQSVSGEIVSEHFGMIRKHFVINRWLNLKTRMVKSLNPA